MIKEAKYLRKQADKAQRLSAIASDPDISRNLMNLASGYRAQAKILKKKIGPPRMALSVEPFASRSRPSFTGVLQYPVLRQRH
jgi:hypothetical protein